MENLENLNLHHQRALIGDLSLPKLEHLDITSSLCKEIKIDFGNLKSLTSLVVWGNQNLENLNDISNPNLRSLTVVNNIKLKKIQLDNNKLNNIEEVIMRLNKSLENRPIIVNNIEVTKNRKYEYKN
jgi:Leucine-rich repeat (LRR) protein